MLEREFQFLNNNIKLVEQDKWLDIYKATSNQYYTNEQNRRVSLWDGILRICYDPEVNIDPTASLTEIPENYFKNFGFFPDTLKIADSVKYIDTNAFLGSNIKNVILSSNIYHIDSYAFRSCEDLIQIEIPESIDYIEDRAFYGCISLKTVIYKGVKYHSIKELEPYRWEYSDKKSPIESCLGFPSPFTGSGVSKY